MVRAGGRSTVVGVVKRLVATDEAHRQVCRAALAGIASESLDDVTGELGPRPDRHFPFPADVFTELAADALRVAGATRVSPVALNDFSDRYVAEYRLRGNTARQKITAALHWSSPRTPVSYPTISGRRAGGKSRISKRSHC